MIFWDFFFLVTAYQVHLTYQKTLPKSVHRREPATESKEGDTVIENKNVNIVVNVDPKEVAKELWKILEKRLDNPPSRRSQTSKEMIKELETIVSPIVLPSRRANEPSAFEIADALDHVTRKALQVDSVERSSMEKEILTRNIVANMMKTLDDVKKVESQLSLPSEGVINYGQTRKSLLLKDEADNLSAESGEDEYVKLIIKIRRSALQGSQDLKYVFA
ncbi:hypothetical protein KQX54_005181 [Cotesia glomerata]|uniref:Uncharacterized protein n=1 Tax=Cotesia glomerata TaxID=32391 RepID=A0AAV7I9N4_COTGL|nr:hypothetical protein KQX54_005181 [Cotesia glomerata]